MAQPKVATVALDGATANLTSSVMSSGDDLGEACELAAKIRRKGNGKEER